MPGLKFNTPDARFVHTRLTSDALMKKVRVVTTSGFCLNAVDSIQFLQLYNMMYNTVLFIYQTPYVLNSSKLKIASIEKIAYAKKRP